MSYTTATSTGIRNIHSRATAGPWSKATTMFDTLSTQDDKLWPADRWPPLELDRGLQVGSRGGHGPVRYHVEAIDPGRSVTFRFDQGSPIVGTHSLSIDPLADGRVSWTHVLEVTRPSPAVTVAILPLHDALLEDLLD